MTDTLVTINPDLLDNPDSFLYRDLQRLCVRLKLGGKGSRVSLVAKLMKWHRGRSPMRSAPTSPSSEAHEMNVAGQRFNLLNVHVAAAPLSPNFSSPNGLLAAYCGETSPGGGQSFPVLKSATKKRRHSIIGGEENNVECVSPRLLNPLKRSVSCPTPKSAMKNKDNGRRKSLLFSPYNGVKIIPHRTDPDAISSPKPWECQ